MKPIIALINSDSLGQDITNLQDGLLQLLEKGLLPINQEEQPAFAQELRQERQEQKYGGATRKLVSSFQERPPLEGEGMVNIPTANALIQVLLELGAFDQPGQAVECLRLVRGLITMERKAIDNICCREMRR